MANYLINPTTNGAADHEEQTDRDIAVMTHLIAAGYILRGRRYRELGKAAEAIRDLTTAIELDPTSVEAHQQRARAQIEIIDLPAANADLRRANELRRPYDEGEPESWTFAAGYELALRRRDGSERTLKTYPLTNEDRDDAILDAALVFSRQEWEAPTRKTARTTPTVYEVFTLHRELGLAAAAGRV